MNSELLFKPEAPPSVVELNILSEIDSETKWIILYCPPILSIAYEDAILALKKKGVAIIAVEITDIGYPDQAEYVKQVNTKLRKLDGFDPDKLVVLGFSTGTSFAGQVGKRFNLAKDDIYYLAPVTSYRPSLARIMTLLRRIFRKRAKEKKPPGKYLQSLRSFPGKIYDPDNSLSWLGKLRILNKTRSAWTTGPSELELATVVTGKRDLISPPGDHSDIETNASHSLAEYINDHQLYLFLLNTED
jgi:hypothetical protein